MMILLQNWWQQRSAREHMLLWILFVLISIISVYFLIIFINMSYAKAQDRYAQALIVQSRVSSDIAAYKQFPHKAGGVDAKPALGVAVTVLATAKEVGLPVSGGDEANPDQGRFTLVSARPTSFFSWLDQLGRHGIVLQKITIRANSDRTISADIVLRRGI